MKIYELLGVKKFANLTVDEIIAQLKKMGGTDVEVLGTGAAGAAISIGRNVYKMWMVDSGYSDFVEYALAHQDNPFMPKFKGDVKRMPAFFLRSDKAPDVVNYIQMERLSPINFDKIVFSNGSGEPIPFSKLIVMMWMHEDDFEKSKLRLNLEDDADPKLLQLLDTIEDLLKIIKPGNHQDLHGGNYMLRGDQLVIIDPISSSKDIKLNQELKRFTKQLRNSQKPVTKQPIPTPATKLPARKSER